MDQIFVLFSYAINKCHSNKGANLWHFWCPCYIWNPHTLTPLYHHHVSTEAQNGQTKHWLEKDPFTFFKYMFTSIGEGYEEKKKRIHTFQQFETWSELFVSQRWGLICVFDKNCVHCVFQCFKSTMMIWNGTFNIKTHGFPVFVAASNAHQTCRTILCFFISYNVSCRKRELFPEC